MLTLKVNGSGEIQVDLSKGIMKMNNERVEADFDLVSPGKYHILFQDKSYTVELLEKDETGKELTLMVNGVKQVVSIRDEYDELLHRLGMDNMTSSKVNEIKAPMPGLVLKIMVKEGDAVKKGDALLVLEAMKMENILKSTGEGVVKKIIAQVKQAVEKNQVLIIME